MADEPVGYYDPPTAAEILRWSKWTQRSVTSLVSLMGVGGNSNAAPPNPIFVKNVASEDIPRFAVVQATGTFMQDDQCYLEVDKPADSSGCAGPFFINLFETIYEDTTSNRNENKFPFGVVTDGPHSNALVETELDAGTALQPEADNWKLVGGGGRFRMIGPNEGENLGDDVYRVKFSGGDPFWEVQFELDNASGLATITEVPCGRCDPPGRDEDGKILVYDTMGCLDLTAGAKGWASWVEAWPLGDDGCYWSIKSLCCPGE